MSLDEYQDYLEKLSEDEWDDRLARAANEAIEIEARMKRWPKLRVVKDE